MAIEYIYPPFEVIRRDERCTRCRICEKQCANGVHTYDAERKIMLADESKCVNCQRCVALCPTRAIKIVKTDCCLRENENWKSDTIREVYKQAATGGSKRGRHGITIGERKIDRAGARPVWTRRRGPGSRRRCCRPA